MLCEWTGQSYREPCWVRRATEVLVSKHSGGKNTFKGCISDLHVQTNKQRSRPQSLSKRIAGEATVAAEAKCNYRKRESSSL